MLALRAIFALPSIPSTLAHIGHSFATQTDARSKGSSVGQSHLAMCEQSTADSGRGTWRLRKRDCRTTKSCGSTRQRASTPAVKVILLSSVPYEFLKKKRWFRNRLLANTRYPDTVFANSLELVLVSLLWRFRCRARALICIVSLIHIGPLIFAANSLPAA